MSEKKTFKNTISYVPVRSFDYVLNGTNNQKHNGHSWCESAFTNKFHKTLHSMHFKCYIK